MILPFLKNSYINMVFLFLFTVIALETIGKQTIVAKIKTQWKQIKHTCFSFTKKQYQSVS